MTSLRAAYEQFQTRGGIADLSERVEIILTGADRVRYLNGQVTSNVTKLAAGQTQPACVPTAKGRLCAEILITAAPDALHIDADPALRATLPARLERYIIADDVTLTEITDTRALLHFLGLPPPEIPGAACVPSRRFGRDGWDVRLPAADFAEKRTALFSDHLRLDTTLLETLRIEAGLPRWGAELGEDTLPPEAGLDRTHIDYHKGCYIGQEVISRLKSVGHVNRQLTGFIAADGAPPVAGAAIFSPDSDRPVGTITSVAFSFALEKPIALGYLRRASPTSGLRARGAAPTSADVHITACPLPFLSS
jgi:tRNA-modifying protein YgfZ